MKRNRTFYLPDELVREYEKEMQHKLFKFIFWIIKVIVTVFISILIERTMLPIIINL